MRLWKKIGNTELDLLSVFTVTEYKENESSDELWYSVVLTNGQKLAWTSEEKALFDREMDIHNETEKIMGAIANMQSSYVGKPIGG